MVYPNDIQSKLIDFFDNKKLPEVVWEVYSDNDTHCFTTETVIFQILHSTEDIQKITYHKLVELDLFNQDIMPFLKHLSEGLTKLYEENLYA